MFTLTSFRELSVDQKSRQQRSACNNWSFVTSLSALDEGLSVAFHKDLRHFNIVRMVVFTEYNPVNTIHCKLHSVQAYFFQHCLHRHLRLFTCHATSCGIILRPQIFMQSFYRKTKGT